MAIMDATLEFCDAVSVVGAAAATLLLGNQADLSNNRNIGGGAPVYLIISVDTPIVTAGVAGTIRFKLVSDDTPTIHATTSTVHLQTGELITDDVPAIPAGGILFCGAIPSGLYRETDYERYLGLQAVITTTAITAGKVNAWLSLDPVGWQATDAAPI